MKKVIALILATVILAVGIYVVPSIGAITQTEQMVQDFEAFDISSKPSRLVKYSLFTSNGTDGNAHSGTKSIYRPATNDTFRVTVFPDATSRPIIEGKTYDLSFWIKIASAITATSTIQLMYSGDKNNAHAQMEGSSITNISIIKKPNEVSTNVDSTKVGEWQEIKYTFTATHSAYLNLSGWGPVEYYLDDVTLKEKELTPTTSTINFNTNGGTVVTPLVGITGSQITMPANPTKENSEFNGWYTDEALTTPFNLTTFPENDITLYAKWTIIDNTLGLVQDFEAFDISSKPSRLVKYTLFTSNGTDGNAHSGTKSIYRPATNDTFRVTVFPDATSKPIIEGKTYDLKFWIKIVSAVTATGTVQLMYSADKNNAHAQISGSLIPNICLIKKPNEVSTNVDSTKVGEWQEIKYTFTATHSAYLNLSGWGPVEYYLDDISLKEHEVEPIVQTTISFETNGGNTIDSLQGEKGMAINMPTTPTREGFVFNGWYTEDSLINLFTATTFPENDITLYAKWIPEGTLLQDFESYNISEKPSRLSKYTIFTSNGTDNNVHSGTKSIYRSAENATYRISVFPEATTKPLVEGNTYELRFFIKLVSPISATSTIQLMYSADKNNSNAQTSGSSMPNISVFRASNETSTNIDSTKIGEWQEVVYTFAATHDAFLNLTGWGIAEYYLDDISLKCISVANTSLSFNSNGGNEIATLKGVAGTALPSLPIPVKEGKMFTGWYTDEALTKLFSESVFPETATTLYAGWSDEGNYLQNFEGYIINGSNASNTLSIYTKQNENDVLVHGGEKSLYRSAETNSYFISPFPYATKKLTKGNGYKLNMWVYAPNEFDKASEGALRLTLLDDVTNAFSIGDKPQTNIKYFNSTFTSGEWQELELIFTAQENGYMGIYTYGSFEMYIDDISLIEVDTVTVSFDTCGGNTVEPQSGPIGQLVSSTPTPIHPDEMAFAGWFTDKEYTERFNFKMFPKNDITVYAKWIEKGSFEQTFEGYYYENDNSNGTYSKDTISIYHATSDNDKYVHSGKTSLKYYQMLSPESKTYGFSIFDPTMGQLEIGEKYYVSYWIKPVEISSTFYHAVYSNSVVDNVFANYNMKGYFTTHKDVIGKTGDVSEYFFGPAGKYSVSEPDKNGWIQFTFEATATDKFFSIYLNWDAEVYIDDVIIKPLPTGVVSSNYPKAYCEPLYDEINYQQPNTLNKKSSGVEVYPIEVNSRGDYIFSAALSKDAKDSYIALSFDADGKNIIEGTKVKAGEKVALRMMMNKSNLIYLVVYNPIGEGVVERATLCRTIAAKESVSTKKPLYTYYTDDELPELSELLKEPQYKEVFLDALFENEFNNTANNGDSNIPESENSIEDSASPQTGDNSPLLFSIIILVISLGCAIVYSIKKRRGSVC